MCMYVNISCHGSMIPTGVKAGVHVCNYFIRVNVRVRETLSVGSQFGCLWIPTKFRFNWFRA